MQNIVVKLSTRFTQATVRTGLVYSSALTTNSPEVGRTAEQPGNSPELSAGVHSAWLPLGPSGFPQAAASHWLLPSPKL